MSPENEGWFALILLAAIILMLHILFMEEDSEQ